MLHLVRTEGRVQTVAHHTHVLVLQYGRAILVKQQVSGFDFIMKTKTVSIENVF